jgi:hypothetical protein
MVLHFSCRNAFQLQTFLHRQHVSCVSDSQKYSNAKNIGRSGDIGNFDSTECSAIPVSAEFPQDPRLQYVYFIFHVETLFNFRSFFTGNTYLKIISLQDSQRSTHVISNKSIKNKRPQEEDQSRESSSGAEQNAGLCTGTLRDRSWSWF